MVHVCEGFTSFGAEQQKQKTHEVAVAHRSFDRYARQASPFQQETGQRCKSWDSPST